jgi:uncharacterized protein
MHYLTYVALAIILCTCSPAGDSSKSKPAFRVIGFFTAKNDKAHITFVHEANKWFANLASSEGFQYDSTDNWNQLNDENLREYEVVIFLDTRPEDASQRIAFERYMKNGGGWMGFHFAGFALNDSDFEQNWDWYHDDFLGAGQFKSNTWRPTPAVLRVQDRSFRFTSTLPDTFRTAPSEWYRWEKDLTLNKDIKIIYAIDTTSFPLGTGPKPDEIWHEGYYPVVWSNTNYNMVYFNMGHNDMDYEGGTDAQLSSTFSSTGQNKLLAETLKYLAETSGTLPAR